MNRPQLGVFALLLLIGIAFACRGHAQTPDQQTPIIREIAFRGVEHISADAQQQMHGAVKSQVGQPLSQDTVDKDVEALRGLGWFVRVSERTEPMEDGVRLIFTVVEAPVITAIDFIGNTQLTDEQLMKVIKMRPGEVPNRESFKPDALAIESAYADRGFTEVRVVDINITQDNKLEFFIFEPKIGEIRIEGNKKTHEYVIRRELTMKPGDVYNVNAVQQSLKNLDALGIFQEEGAVPEPGTEPGMLIVAISVKERRTGLASLGVGHSNIEGLIGFVDVADTNLFGTGQRLSLQVQFGADDSYQLSYTNPWIDPHKTSFDMNLYDRTILRQAVQVNQSFLYDEKRTGGNISFGRPIGRTTRGIITFRVDRVRGVLDQGSVPSDVSQKSIDYIAQGSNVRSITLSGIRDTRNDLFYPSGGAYSTLATELAGLGGANFTKVTLERRRYWNLRPAKQTSSNEVTSSGTKKNKQPPVFATRFMLGYTGGNTPSLDQFLLGGADTLRGYKEDRFPGERMLLWNNEIRVPFNESLQGVLFADAGDAWYGQFANDFGDADFKLHYGYGAGIRVVTPIGPLRLDYGFNGEGGHEFHFGVGSTF